MPVHVPKRVYTASALEGWFSNLSQDWGVHFTDHELALGQQFYEGGIVTSIELQNTSAIIHGRLEGKDTYVLIEWESTPPVVRSSTSDRLQGRGLAVAGLYEIEEMVADSVSALPPEAPEEAPAKPRFSTGLFADTKKPTLFSRNTPATPASATGSFFRAPSATTPGATTPAANGNSLSRRSNENNETSRNASAEEKSSERDSRSPHSSTPSSTGLGSPKPVVSSISKTRELVVKFTVLPEGLVFDAFWKKPDDESAVPSESLKPSAMEPALKSYKSSAPQMSEREREGLIRLTALARKNGFELAGRQHDYLLGDFTKLPELVKTGLATWKKYFTVEMGPDVLLLAHGPRTITVEVEARDGGAQLQFHWLFLLGGRELTKEQIKELLKKPHEAALIPELGLVHLSPEQSDVISDWQEAILSDSGLLPKYMLFSIFRQDALPIRLSKGLEGWTRALLDEPNAVDGLPSFLRDYQRRGVAWLKALIDNDCHPLLADEMGLGKTLQVLSLLKGALNPTQPQSADSSEKQIKIPAAEQIEELNLPSLVVAPASVVPVWAGEIQKHFPGVRVEILSHNNLPSAPAFGNSLNADDTTPATPGNRTQIYSQTNAQPQSKSPHGFHFHKHPSPQAPLPAPAESTQPRGNVLWLASYGQLKRQAAELEKTQFAYAVLDEAQMMKNPKTKTARACYSLHARHRLAMTGTPVENKPLDLWSIFRFLMPGLLGGSNRFEQLNTDEAGKFIEKLHQQVSPFILRRTKAEVAKELPDKIEEVLIAPMGQLQREHYARLVEQGIKRFGNDLRKAGHERGLAFFTLLTRLRQASCDAGLLPWVKCEAEESGKIQVMLDKLEGIIASGSKVVIFSQFVGFLKRIEAAIDARFGSVPRYQLTGATIDRQKPVADFQAQRGAAIMLVSLRAGGTGITLHAADYLFLMDPWWNPAVEDQAIDRVHRIGQKNTVFVYRVVSEGTVEARIQALKASKKELFNNIVGAIRDNTHFALYFKSMTDLIALAPKDKEEESEGDETVI